MRTHLSLRVGLALGASIWFMSSGVLAQASGEIEPAPEPPPPAVEPPPPAVEPPPPPPPAPAETVEPAEPVRTELPANDLSDHAAMVGRTGVGFLGISSVPVGGPFGAVPTPVIGVRHWMSEGVGLDLGLGLGFERTSSKLVPDGLDSIPGRRQLALGFAAHVALPLAIFHQRHYAFLIVPEADVGFGFAKDDPDPDFNDDEQKYLGVVVQGGARFGSEVHFGFIGIPQLSLQASVGAHARYEWTQAEDVPTGLRTRADDLAFGTTVQSSPWNIFIANVAALYYF